jgi:hypothetical protein
MSVLFAVQTKAIDCLVYTFSADKFRQVLSVTTSPQTAHVIDNKHVCYTFFSL